MKQIIFIFLVTLVSITASAQLKNTEWKGTIHSDNDIDVLFDYGSDTLYVINVADSSSLETLTYTVKDGVITFQKIKGQSGCDTAGKGTYKFEIKENVMYVTLVSDTCDDRSSAMKDSKWVKVKK